MKIPKIFQVSTIQRFAHRKWYVFLISLVAALDIFIFIIPTEAILVSSVILTPDKWKSRFIWVAIGSSIGALILALIIHLFGVEALHAWLGETVGTEKWTTLTRIMKENSFLGVFTFSLGPLPHQGGVILAMISGGTLYDVFFGTLLGRLIKYGFFAWIGTHAPAKLQKYRFFEDMSSRAKSNVTHSK